MKFPTWNVKLAGIPGRYLDCRPIHYTVATRVQTKLLAEIIVIACSKCSRSSELSGCYTGLYLDGTTRYTIYKDGQFLFVCSFTLLRSFIYYEQKQPFSVFLNYFQD
jgi:hypothetical protein